ncbi:hypothetical protein EJB05_22493, partial [Eragrostis curvula]
MTEEREASPAAEAFVLAIFCGGGVNCCCRWLLRRAARVAARRRKSDSLLRLPSPDLRRGGDDRDALGTDGGVARPTAAGIDSLAAADGEGKAKLSPASLEPVRAGFREIRGATAPLPAGIKNGSEDATKPPVAVEPMGVSGCFGDAKNERPPLVLVLVGVSGPSGGAANTKPPFAVGPVDVGVLGRSAAAKNEKKPTAGFAVCPCGAKNGRALRGSDPPGVHAAFSRNAKMFPGEAGAGSATRGAVSNENSPAGERVLPARDATGEGDGEGEGVRDGGGGGVDAGADAGATSKGASSSSILLRTEEAGTRQRRLLRPAPAAAQGAEKATAEGAVSMRSSARCRGGGVRKKACGSAAAMAGSRAGGGFLDSWGGALGNGEAVGWDSVGSGVRRRVPPVAL